jgi:hypothetical protein
MSLQNIDGSYNVTLQATANTVNSLPVPTPLTCFPLANGYELSVAMEPNQVFWEDWGTGVLDTVNKWNAANLSTGTSTTTVGSEVLASTTTTNAWAFLQSQFQFPGRNPGYNFAQLQIQLEASPVVTNAYRFWGFATIPGSPTAALPLTNAVGFEIGITGKMVAVTFASGNRTQIKDLSSSGSNIQPLDGATHKYEIFFRGDNILWYIDAILVASTITGALGPDINTLNLSFLTVANTVAPSATATVTIAQASVGDTSRNAQRIVDGTYNWRSAQVTPQGQLVVGNLTPGTPITASATGTTGAVAATLTGVANKTTYITGFTVSSSGATTPTAVTVTVVGTISGTLNYVYPVVAVATENQAPLSIVFPDPVPASATNTSIVVNLNTGIGAGGIAAAVAATGFQL